MGLKIWEDAENELHLCPTAGCLCCACHPGLPGELVFVQEQKGQQKHGPLENLFPHSSFSIVKTAANPAAIVDRK